MGVKASEIIGSLEKYYPKGNAESWDNVGLLVGSGKKMVEKVQISLDATESVIDKAIEDNVDMLITHHPMIFSPVKAITDNNLQGKKILKLIQNDINLYCLHTNLDSSNGGLNEYICKKIGFENSKVLEESYYDMYKLSFYVPDEFYEEAILIIEKSKLEFQGFEGVSYSSEVVERYKSLENEEKNIVTSKKIEIIGEKGKLSQILNSIRKKHPYEEVAYDIMKIDNKYVKNGIGRIVDLSEKKAIKEIAELVKNKLSLDTLKMVSKNPDKKIKRIAIVNGSGMSFGRKLKRMKVDLFLTGDIKYHEGLDAMEDGIDLFDIGHYESEHFFHEIISDKISDKDIEISVYNEEAVFKYL